MSGTTQSLHCDKCGAVLSGYGAERLCAACLLESAILEPEAPAHARASVAPLLAFNDYELIEELARGGMGVVYRARQISLNRPVAIKMILGGHLANATEMKRFRAEAETAAQLRHPNIVAIHEVGEHAGQPFFSMDLVEGQNLAQLVRNEPLPSRKAAAYLKTIAEAVQYAHSRGVLHRDLKPSNILIEANDQPRITDFGLAKRFSTSVGTLSTASQSESGKVGDAVERVPTHELTQTGQVLGSPSFIPPEQAAGQKDQIGPASDVYSLGAILYHCLTARPPFMAETLTQTLRMVAEQEPASPHLLNASVPRDLETICLKCLEKQPKRRYATAQEVAQELGRFLEQKPIHARPASAVGKVHRWCLRNKPLAAAGTGILALLLVVAIGSPIAVFRINRERQQAEANQRKAQQESAKSQQVAKFLQDMLAGIDPNVARGRDTSLMREILERSVQRISVEFTNHAEVQAQLENTVGIVYAGLGEPQKAEQLHARALTTRRSLYGNQHPAVAESLYWLGADHWQRGRAGEAERLIREALAIRRKVFGSESEDVAHTLNLLALVLVDRAKWAEAEAATREGLAIKISLSGRKSLNVVKSLNMLGLVFAAQGRNAEAEKVIREALDLYRAISADDVFPLTHLLSCLGQAIGEQGRFDEAEGVLRELLEVERKYLGNEHPDTAAGMSALAQTLRRQGDLTAAEALLRESLAVREKKLPNAWHTFHTRTQLGEVLLGQKKYEEAERLLLAGLDGMKQRANNIRDYGKLFPEVIQNLIRLYEATGEPDKAAEWRKNLAELNEQSAVTTSSGQQGSEPTTPRF